MLEANGFIALFSLKNRLTKHILLGSDAIFVGRQRYNAPSFFDV